MKIKHMEISFWRRKSRQEGKIQIYCRITVAGEQMDIGSTGLTLWDDHWDQKQKQVKKADPEAFFKNEQLDLIKNQLRATFNDLYRKEEKITAAKVRRAYMGQSLNISLITAFELYLKDSASDPERDLKGSSLEVYDNVRKKLINFLIDHKALDLLIEDFDLTWVKKFRRWIKQVRQGGGKIGHADSYIVKHTQTIRNVLTWAKLNKLADSNPLEGLRIKNAIYGDPVALTEEEFQRLRSHRFDNSHLQQTADIFIILCRCGFHYGDLKDFLKQHKTALQTGVNGEPWIVKDRIKTAVAIRIPVFEEVQEVVDKYGGGENLPLISSSKFNIWLKVLAAELKFPEDLSTKASRKAFTDWCFNVLFLSTDAVKVLLGRKSDKGLEVYGKPNQRRVAGELEQSKEMQKKDKKEKGQDSQQRSPVKLIGLRYLYE